MRNPLTGSLPMSAAEYALPMEPIWRAGPFDYRTLEQLYESIQPGPELFRKIRQNQNEVNSLIKSAMKPLVREDSTQNAQGAAAAGRFGDSLVAHISPEEAMMLKAAGGSGTTNPETGFLEFWDSAGDAGGGWAGAGPGGGWGDAGGVGGASGSSADGGGAATGLGGMPEGNPADWAFAVGWEGGGPTAGIGDVLGPQGQYANMPGFAPGATAMEYIGARAKMGLDDLGNKLTSWLKGDRYNLPGLMKVAMPAPISLAMMIGSRMGKAEANRLASEHFGKTYGQLGDMERAAVDSIVASQNQVGDTADTTEFSGHTEEDQRRQELAPRTAPAIDWSKPEGEELPGPKALSGPGLDFTPQAFFGDNFWGMPGAEPSAMMTAMAPSQEEEEQNNLMPWLKFWFGG